MLGENIVHHNVLDKKKLGEFDETFFWKKQPAVSTRKNEVSLDFIINRNDSLDFENSINRTTFIDPKSVSTMNRQLL